MLIEEKNAKNLAKLFLTLSKTTAIQAHEYIGSHSRITGYCKYPVKDIHFPKDNPEFKEINEKVPFLFYDIPKYSLNDFPENCIQYGAIFNGYANDRLDCTSMQEFNNLIEFIDNTAEVKKMFNEKEDIESIKLTIKRLNIGIVERYLYSIKATENAPDDLVDKIIPFIEEFLNRYIRKKLYIDIYVPICLVTFDDDVIKLSDNIEIVRMSEEVQKARQKACQYEAVDENWVAACATHMIVIHNYQFDNTKNLSINSATANYNAYPIQIIDNIMAALRVVTNYPVGYCQILSLPLGWIDNYFADLIPLYGAKTHFVNANEIKKGWLFIPVNKISVEQVEKIKKIYGVIHELESDSKVGNLLFALKRFNRCLLRNEVDDMAIDATIGLEALLSGGTKGEITYTISNRIPIVFLYEKNEKYFTTNCRSIMKKIYNYRSKVVHGATIKEKDKYFEINGDKYEIEKIAVDFLRHTLLFVLDNKEFLDAQKFDEYIDGNISKKEEKKEDCLNVILTSF